MIDLPVINNEKKLLSLTYFVVLKKENFSLILAYPVTGRKNQLRRHFSGIGHPIVEEKYHINKSDEIRVINSFCIHYH